MGLTFEQAIAGFQKGFDTGKQIWEQNQPATKGKAKGKARSFSAPTPKHALAPIRLQHAGKMSATVAGPPLLTGRVTVDPATAYAGGGYGGGTGGSGTDEIVGFEIDPKFLYAGAGLLLLLLFLKKRRK